MAKIEFNLLDESWIRVRLPDNSIREVSLIDALLYAHEYVDLAGETPTQDAAVLRLLLSIPLTIFYRVDKDGNAVSLTSSDDALLRWKSLWEQGHFPEKPIREYLEQWHERFWLFHPERPFWQVPEAAVGTEYKASKLNGEISESDNKARLFPLYAGKQKNSLSYAQAARWLLYVNAFDDTSSKPKGKNLPSVGVGWLGKIGFIQAEGRNLFETLLLNMTMLKDGQALWRENKPCWELDFPRNEERTEIAVPDNFAQLLTLQSRRLLLRCQGDKVIGLTLLGGDFFQKENTFSEQMTIWRSTKVKKNEPISYVPKRHDVSKKFWREFSSAFCEGEGSRKPGIVQWIELLQSRRLHIIDSKQLIHFKAVGTIYGDKDFFANDCFMDSLSFQMNILAELEKAWRSRITEEINKCETAARYLGELERDLAVAGGFSYSDKTKSTLEKHAEAIQGDFYFAIDDPFRQWLRSIDTEEDDLDEKADAWQKNCRALAMAMGRKMVRESGSAALLGHWAEITKGKRVLWTSARAYNIFQSKIRSLYPQTKEEGGELNGKTAGD